MNGTFGYQRRRGSRLKYKRFLIFLVLLLFVVTATSAEDSNDSGDNDNDDDDDDDDADDYFSNSAAYYTNTPTPKPTASPTGKPTRSPTRAPTDKPTPYPTAEPTREGDDFYEIDNDDGYTAEAQVARIYFSSITDVILCLMCTFFWVLWLVGTIFPTKIQHLYKTEGIVVQGFVVESYVANINNPQDISREMRIHDPEIDLAASGGGGMEDMELMEGMSADGLPTYHAVVTYVVPGRITSGRRGRIIRKMSSASLFGQGSSSKKEDYKLQSENVRTALNNRDVLNGLDAPSRQGPQGSNKNFPPLTPPRYPVHAVIRKHSEITTPMSNIADKGSGGLSNMLPTVNEGRQGPRRGKSLLDAYTKSFDSVDTDKPAPELQVDTNDWLGGEKGYYKYNKRDDSDYESPLKDDEYVEDPEHIGNLFYHFGLISNQKRKVIYEGPVRVKKRFETNEILEPGVVSNTVEIIVLPGNPGSGILKTDFEQNENYNNISSSGGSTDDDQFSPGNMGELYSGIIGIVLAAVSVIGAVHGALTLPYQKRMYGWVLVVISLSIMWPLAMLCYKTVNKLRLFMMNKIINLEPCGDKTNLYGLSKIPMTTRGMGMSCSDKGSDSGNEYIIMLDNGKKGRGGWHYDEGSAMSSLSGGGGVDLRRII
eukprot:CAMPEP_0194080798 /NCGR_PEP_ID=MMETSP0149-20130528/6731_1 /TAXON_ID=122233 /ORGANISM="Chaetoceros debilis, Strain MM31A-1" /LENGTH=651 /DNA_ID=CAMNT_0038762591 /DNA_START=103 /DNA_END=2058 /DNA_ORIENTATION=-